jgi:proteasome accessory factor B
MTLQREARAGLKWDRAARYLKIARVLHQHREGVGAADIARLVGVSRRTVYRDLAAMERDAGLPIWQEAGRYGLEEGAFLPPLDLTLHEAMTLFLALRVLAKASDEYDSELIGAFVKLAGVLPKVLAEHVQATADLVAGRPPDARFTRVFRTLTEAWAHGRVVQIEYEAGAYDPSRGVRRARVRPYAIEPSALTHALYLIGLDEERHGRRTFKVERIRAAALTADSFESEEAGGTAADLARGWDVIGDQPMETVVVRFTARVARRVAETRWHASQELAPQPDGSLLWRGRVAGLHEILVWILGWGADAEVMEPPELRSRVAEELRRAAAIYATAYDPEG